MNILITGANGYIGKSLVSKLKEKYNVTPLTRNEADLKNLSSLKKFFDKKYFDVVIHCAVKGGNRLLKDNWTVLDDNLLIYYNLLQFQSQYGKFINFGSGAEDYMENEPYGFSKKVITKSIRQKDNFYNLKIFAVFDENELDTRFIKGNLLRYIDKTAIQIHQNKLMDFFYMEDLVRIVKYYLENSNLEKEIECVYSQKYYLSTIAEKINQLDSYRVDVKIESSKPAERYIGKYMIPYEIDLVGLDEGIRQTYVKLKGYERN